MIRAPRITVTMLWGAVLTPIVGVIATIVASPWSGGWLLNAVFGAVFAIAAGPGIGLATGALAWAGAAITDAWTRDRLARIAAAGCAAFAGVGAVVVAVFQPQQARADVVVPLIVYAAVAGVAGAAATWLDARVGRRFAIARRLRARGLSGPLGFVGLVVAIGAGWLATVFTVAASFDGGAVFGPACRSLGSGAIWVGSRDFPPQTFCQFDGVTYSTAAPWETPLIVGLVLVTAAGATVAAIALSVAFRQEDAQAESSNSAVHEERQGYERAHESALAAHQTGHEAGDGGAPRGPGPQASGRLSAAVGVLVLTGALAASLAAPDSPWRGPAFRGQPVGYFQVNAAAVPKTPTPTATRPATPATPRTPRPPSHGPVPSAQPLPAGSTEQRIDALILRTLAAAGSDTSVVRSDTDHSRAPSTANFASCTPGETAGVYSALAENVPEPDTNQALYDRIARAWEAAGYSSQDMALGTELFEPAAGADAPEARLSIRGVPDGVAFSIQVVCPGPGS